MIENFLRKAMSYWAVRSPSLNILKATIPPWLQAVSAVSPSPLASAQPASILSTPSHPIPHTPHKRYHLRTHRFQALGRSIPIDSAFDSLYHHPASSASSLGEIWLDSSKVNDPNSFAYSYLSTPDHLLSYQLRPDPTLTLYQKDVRAGVDVEISTNTYTSSPKTFFEGLNDLQRSLSARTRWDDSDEGGPEWKAGWVGWFNYEMKAESLAGYRLPDMLAESLELTKGRDAVFAFSTAVLALEHSTKEWVLLGVMEEGSEEGGKGGSELEDRLIEQGVRFGLTVEEWEAEVSRVSAGLSHLAERTERADIRPSCSSLSRFIPQRSGEEYTELIESARSAIHEGESYELTLTTQFESSFLQPDAHSAYELYLLLRTSNPAPYSSYLSFPSLDLSVVSSSPERFLKITSDRRVEMKPIKGTVGRSLDDPVEDQRRKQSLKQDKKEIAENLMVRSFVSFTLKLGEREAEEKWDVGGEQDCGFDPGGFVVDLFAELGQSSQAD